ncbi:MAG: (d)CMP kinase [Alphaproteobacteria bacterium]|nr:(d)CMP kinase [Alphaproteobacteria bacterium]
MKNRSLLIAIDGPSASGKGTLAKKIAAHFNLPYLNTGALYRLLALRVIEQKTDPENVDELVKNISAADLEDERLFSEDVGLVASMIAKNPKIRAALFAFQREFAQQKTGAVLDGRDTTTVIAPNADFKFYVTADVEIRAQRRFKQLASVPYAEILAQLKKRDENDVSRQDAPLLIADDAHIIDNGHLSIEEGFQKILKIIKSKG